MSAEIIVGAIAATAAVLVALVGRIGGRADRAQKALTDRAAREHQQFQELKDVAEMRAADAKAAREQRDQAVEDLVTCESDRRRLRSDLAAAYLVMRDEIAKEAMRTAEVMERAEDDTLAEYLGHEGDR